jgi:hypothetical protein
MKNVFIAIIIAIMSVSAKAELANPTDAKVTAVWAGYVGGAIIGSQIASRSIVSTVVGYTATGAPIITVPFTGILAGTFAGAVVGAVAGYVIYEGVTYVIDNKGAIVARIKADKASIESMLKDKAEIAALLFKLKMDHTEMELTEASHKASTKIDETKSYLSTKYKSINIF